jgi:hypothetical protein
MINRFYYTNQWFLRYEINNMQLEVVKKDYIIPPYNKHWADPHIIKENRIYYIFIEEYIYIRRKGYIAVIEMDENGEWRGPFQVIKEKYHMSYPFVFKNEEKFYMIPETKNNNCISLYESDRFPYSWKYKMNLFENVKAVDTTLLRYNNKWWLFTNIGNEDNSTYTDLYLFYSDNFLTHSWIAHPFNPIVSDISRARPAGKIYECDGKLFRPSQDCSKYYGYAININRIDKLNESEYHESKIDFIKPDESTGIIGTHTYSKEDNLTVIDVMRRIPRLKIVMKF